MSPMKASRSPLNASAANLASEARRKPYASSPSLRPQHPGSPTSSVQTSMASLQTPKDEEESGVPPTPSFSLVSSPDPEPQDAKGEGSFWNLGRWKPSLPTLSGLRYSTTFSSPSTPTGSHPAVAHARTESDGLSPRAAKPSARRSMGVNEIRRLKGTDDVNRRRSTGPLLSVKPRLSESGSVEECIDESPETGDELSSSKKRTDSGVAELSAAESTDSDRRACRDCGSTSFEAKRYGRERTVQVCNGCGTKT